MNIQTFKERVGKITEGLALSEDLVDKFVDGYWLQA